MTKIVYFSFHGLSPGLEMTVGQVQLFGFTPDAETQPRVPSGGPGPGTGLTFGRPLRP